MSMLRPASAVSQRALPTTGLIHMQHALQAGLRLPGRLMQQVLTDFLMLSVGHIVQPSPT